MGERYVAFQRVPVRISGIDGAVDIRSPIRSLDRERLNEPEFLWLHHDGRLRFLGHSPPKRIDEIDEVVQFDDLWALDPTGSLHCLHEQCNPPPLSAPARRFSSTGGFGCAVVESGAIECWGSNGRGAVDPASETNGPDGRPTEIRRASIRGVEDAVDVVAGREHACALRKDGTVWCWGSGYQGNLGTSELPSGRGSHGPVRVPGIDDAERIVTGEYAWTTCAIRTGGRLSCWGWSGEWFDRAKIEAGPVDVTGAKDVTLVGVHGQWVCYATRAGEVHCAGLSHIEDGKGNVIPGGPGTRIDVYYGPSPTEFRKVFPADSHR